MKMKFTSKGEINTVKEVGVWPTLELQTSKLKCSDHFAINCNIFHFAETKVVFSLGGEHRQVIS